jgi:hypothetical protein
VAASALLKIDVDRSIAAEKTPLVGARRTRGVGEDTNGPLKAPRVDTKLAPQALDLLDDEPRMIKEALAGRGQRDTTAIARQEVYTKLLLHSTNAGDAVEACNDSGGCTGISSRGRRRRGMPANPDEIAPSVFYLLSDAPDSEDTAFVRLMRVLN